jgi:hypothetical protein
MSLPEAVKRLLFQFAAIFPVPTGQPGEAHEERVRQWTYRFCQQAAFAFPSEGYGAKRAGDGRPLSKDTLAKALFNHAGDVTDLYAWDLLLGTGTGNPQLAHDPEYHHIPEQVFVPVTPVDYLGASAPSEDDEDDEKPQPEKPSRPEVCECGVGSVVEMLALMNQDIVDLEIAVEKKLEAALMILSRLEDANSQPRAVEVSGRWTGTLRGEVSGIDG